MTTPAVPVRKFVADALERVGWTFVETFAGAVAVAAVAGRLDLPVIYAAAIAAAAAALTVVKALAASRLGTLGTAATLPADLTPMAPAPPPIILTASTSASTVAGMQVGPPPANDAEELVAELGLDQPIDPAPPAPGTSSLPSPRSSPPVESLGHVDPPDVPPAPSRTALGARAERDKAAAEARAAKAAPAKKATPAKRPARKATAAKKASSSTASASAARGKAAAKKAAGTRKRSR